MMLLAEFTLPAADFPLGRVFERWPDLTFDLDRVVPNGDTVMPYFWVSLHDSDADLETVCAALDDLTELRSAVLMERLDDRGLFRAEWDPEYLGIMRAISVAEVTVVSASGSSSGWMFELRADDRTRFSTFDRHCREHGIDAELARLCRLSEMTVEREYGLTNEQRDALVRAYRNGYYDDVRAVDQTTLAAELDITRQAFASRLRRGYRNLIENTLVHGDDDRELINQLHR